MLGFLPTVYDVTASRAKKKEGLNLAHKLGDLGAFARSSSIPFLSRLRSFTKSWCGAPRNRKPLFCGLPHRRLDDRLYLSEGFLGYRLC